MPKNSNKSILFLTELLCLLFLCGLFSATIFLPAKTNNSKDLVYCPLQKLWVKQHQNPLQTRQNRLEQICMSNARKQDLFTQIISKKAFAIDEQGIFETLQKGVKVLDGYRKKPNDFPPRELAQIQYFLGGLNLQKNWNLTVIVNPEKFAFAQNSCQPTALKSNKFGFQFVRKLSEISLQINPRSPPFSI